MGPVAGAMARDDRIQPRLRVPVVPRVPASRRVDEDREHRPAADVLHVRPRGLRVGVEADVLGVRGEHRVEVAGEHEIQRVIIAVANIAASPSPTPNGSAASSPSPVDRPAIPPMPKNPSPAESARTLSRFNPADAPSPRS